MITIEEDKDTEKTFKGYANYGVLAAEKRVVFTSPNKHVHASVSDEVEFTVPDGWELGWNAMGDPIITAPWGDDYTPDELLGGKEEPYFTGFDKDMKQFNIKLKWKGI